MSDICLSREEMRDLCGTPLKERQFEFLRSNGIRHYKGLDGRPRVVRSAVEGNDVGGKVAAPWKPNKAA